MKYKDLVNKKSPKEDILRNSLVSFIVGGSIGVLGQLIVDIYMKVFDITNKTASTYMIVTLIFIGCLLTCLGFFDKVIHKARCGLLIPITGFANSMQSAALEYKKEGFVTGIGANMFISSYIFGLIRVIINAF